MVGVVAVPAAAAFMPGAWQEAVTAGTDGATAAHQRSRQHQAQQQASSSPRVLFKAPLVVCSAGALHTPALLLRSGIKGRGNVGRNLRWGCSHLLSPAWASLG